MYYSAIGSIAIIVLLIENMDVLTGRISRVNTPAGKTYRWFLFSVLFYYVTDVLWGVIESRKIAGLLFADPGKVRRLNEAVHPLVKEEIKNRVEALKKSGKDLIAIESALLAEGGLNDLTDTVWFVDTPEEIRIKRLQDSRGYTEEHCRSVMSRQRTVQQYRREADLVIHNEGIPVDLEDQVSSAMHQYRRRFTAR